MQNMEVTLNLKEIHILTPAQKIICLTYKKMSITTNHQLQKYQNKNDYHFKNNIVTINDQVKFKLSKQFEFNTTKIVIIIIGVKGKQIICLGDISIDLATLKEKKMRDKQFFKIKLDKCKDPKAFLTFDIKFNQKLIDLNQIKRNKKQKQKIPELGILKTQCYYKQELYISRREKQDKPTAYQISRKNYVNSNFIKKNNQILRNNPKTISKEKIYSKDTLKQNNNNGSYRKRYEYEVKRLDKSRQKSTNKQIGSNYLKVYQKDKSPSPRTKTPQPITLETLKSKQTYKRTERKISPLNLSGFQGKVKTQLDDTNQLVDPDTFRANGSNRNNQQHNQHQYFNKQIQNDLSQSNISSNSLQSIVNQKNNKYKTITQKLQIIENNIKRSRDKYSQHSFDQDLKQTSSKVSKYQIGQIQSYEIQTGNKELKLNQATESFHNQQKHNFSYPQMQNVPSKLSQTPVSPSQSTCPRNQKPPSPIQFSETPVINKQLNDEIKMSEFTINSKKNQTNEPEHRKSPQTSSPTLEKDSISLFTNKSSFDQIAEPSINRQYIQNPYMPVNQQNLNNKSNSLSPQNRLNQKRQISPPTLSFQRRESEIKLQKKSSTGRNYIETQVKMLQLQIQDKDMKYQRLDKKLIKKQAQCGKLIRQVEQYQKKIVLISNQLIELRTRNLQLQKQGQKLETITNQLNNKTKELKLKQEQIINLTKKIQNLKIRENQNVTKQTDIQQQHKLQTQNKIKNSQIIALKDQMITSLNSQLQTYQNEISSLRQRTDQLQKFKSKCQVLLQNNEQNLKNISILQEKLKQCQIQKSISSNSSFNQSPRTVVKHNSPQQSCSTQQLLRQTIQKQSLLQQALKSLQTQNKALSEKLQSVQNQNKSFIEKLESVQKINKQLLNKINQDQSQKKTLMNGMKSYQNDAKGLLQKLEKKQKTIQKLTLVNESLNSQLFNHQQHKNNKIQELNEQTQTLVMKNAENQQLINELNSKIISKEKQIKILKQVLRQKQNSQNQTNKIKQEMRRQIPNSSENSFKNEKGKFSQTQLISKSGQLLKIKVTQQGKQNFYQNYLNQKAKCTNLQAQLRFAQNQIRNQKMRIQLLTQEKKNLEQQIDMIAYNNEKDLAKKGLEHKISMESQSISDTVKLQNRALKQEIKLLQCQVKDLNILLDSAIQKTQNIQVSQVALLMNSHPEIQKNIINEKYLVLVKRLEAYENQLRTKKNKMAEIVNAIWRGGNASLIDQIDRIMGVEE